MHDVHETRTAEYEAAEALESKVAHDADKVETLLQATEYENPGVRNRTLA